MSNKVIQINVSIPSSAHRVKLNLNLSDAEGLQKSPDVRVEEVETHEPEYVQQELKVEDNQLTVSEHVFLRESAYDKRINKLKREMMERNADNSYQQKLDIPATPLHPDVHNLPHNIISVDQQANSVLPDVEETE